MDESIHLGEDQLFQMEYLPFAEKIVFVSDKLYNYRWWRPGSIMHETSENKLQKQLLHVNLVDKAFAMTERRGRSPEMKRHMLMWSVFFFWGEILNLLEQEQFAVASALKAVWEKYEYNLLASELDVWSRTRYNHIILMSEPDRDKRIAAFAEANAAIKQEIEELKLTPEYKEYIRIERRNNSLIRKVFHSFRENGFIGTVKKIILRLRRVIKW
jgi:hypothetical protein